ncbi:glycosyltransferase family A protein [Chroococcidiopsis sp. TS-821]|uniref:glycosyltransferase family 2 protein n=1 Tax=Chroococcidiopsis sp. TS-821 TaxID=1378066 RepID=UPI000CEE7BE7|nr:glycosyltransferase family A protein [Chroococcidiopsis sp. TS-821]PPS40646.1 hypothetical protein B1A85_19400 [Chroococcidiopsis sp. TS-821]
MPKVSVLMSVYNGEIYLQGAIESILKQTFQDFEFLIINDGSKDSTPQILSEHAAKDPRIVVIHNETNIGLDRSLNKGIERACGEYLARIDADDLSLPERLQQQVAFLDAHTEIGAVGTAVEIIDERGVSVGKEYPPVKPESVKVSLLINNYLHHCSMMLRTHLVRQVGGYDETKRYVEDYDLWWRLSRVSGVANLPDVLSQRRYSGKSITWTNRQAMLNAALGISLNAVQESLQAQLDEESYKRFWWSYHSQRENLHVESALRSHDIAKLKPFWQFLSTCTAGSEFWGPRLRTLAYNLLRRKHTLEGLQLLWIATHQLKTPMLWRSTLKSLIKPYIPEVGQQIWRNQQLKQSGN